MRLLGLQAPRRVVARQLRAERRPVPVLPAQLPAQVGVDEIDAVSAAAQTLDGPTPGAVLDAWLRRFYAYFTSKRLVASELLQVTDADAPVFGEGLTRVLDAARPLLDAAQASGEVRAELGVEQVLELVAAVGRVGGDEAHREPLLRVVLDGLRAGS